MTDDERAAYLAAAERLDAMANADPFPHGTCAASNAVLEIAASLPEGAARTALEQFLGEWRDYHAIQEDEPCAWMLQAAALKLRAQVEEACLG